MKEVHTVLDQQLPGPSIQEMSTLDHDLEKSGTGGLSSVNTSISMPIPETILQVDQQRPPSTNEIATSDFDLEKSGTGGKTSISTGIPETETLDIEHVPVQNDPREWSSFRKVSFPIRSWVLHHLHLFYYSLSYIARYSGIDFFCILNRWTGGQYTESCVFMVDIAIYCLTITYIAAVIEMEAELPATPSQFSLSIALFILFQGSVPLVWSSISEIKGRKASHIALVDSVLN